MAKHAPTLWGLRSRGSVDRRRTTGTAGGTLGWVVLGLRYKLEPEATLSGTVEPFILKTYRQTGQVALDLSHGIMQPSWNGCLHGRDTTTWSSGSSVFNANWSLHTAQSRSSSGARGPRDQEVCE